MKFPVIVFEDIDKQMFTLDDPYLMGDMRIAHKVLVNVHIVDSEGKLWKVKKVEKSSGIKLWQSIKNLGLIVKFKATFDGDPSEISLVELKERIMAHVVKHPKAWLSLDTVSEIRKRVNQAESFEELIRIFR